MLRLKKPFELIEQDQADLILEIPHGFEQNLDPRRRAEDIHCRKCINGVKANLRRVLSEQYHQKLQSTISGLNLYHRHGLSNISSIEIISSNWFNPLLNYRVFMVPGILAILVTMIGGFLSALEHCKRKRSRNHRTDQCNPN